MSKHDHLKYTANSQLLLLVLRSWPFWIPLKYLSGTVLWVMCFDALQGEDSEEACAAGDHAGATHAEAFHAGG
jgi:hypothetical protein